VKYLLDTCLVSESIRPSPEPVVLDWIGAQEEEDLYLCSLSLGELQKGIEKLSRGERRSRLELWFGELRSRFGDRILPVDAEVAMSWGHVAARLAARGIALPVIDGLLASCAIQNGLVLVTRNVKDFEETEVELFNPWDLTARE
jgi:toxin FitB